MILSEVFHARVRGKRACFTRPEFRTERYSNVVASVSGWEGCLRQIQGHRGTTYYITSVALLFLPRWVPATTNEIRSFGNGTKPINTEDVRTLRTTTLLAGNKRVVKKAIIGCPEKVSETVSGVDYIVSYRLAANRDDFPKLQSMHNNRFRNGHYFRQPYLGLREFPALVEPVTDFRALDYPEGMELIEHPNGLKTAKYNEKLGLTFYGTDWLDPAHPNYFAPLEVKNGIVQYPSWDEVKRLGIRKGAAA